MTSRPLLLGLSFMLLLAASACSGALGGGPTVRITGSEWGLVPNVTSVRSGKVRFEFANQGREVHEVVFLKSDRPASALPPRPDNPDRADEDAVGQVLDEIEDVDPGKTKSKTVNLTPGRYLLLCNEPGHYKQGMITEFRVE